MLLAHLKNNSSKNDNLVENVFRFDNWFYKFENSIALLHGGVHPKHNLMGYHKFFSDRIKDGDSVIDIGCGVGAVAFTMAKSTNADILGIDISNDCINVANSKHRHKNLNFILADVFKWVPDKKYDVIILSNVLEHFNERESFLIRLSKVFKPKKILIRVPSFERDWRVL